MSNLEPTHQIRLAKKLTHCQLPETTGWVDFGSSRVIFLRLKPMEINDGWISMDLAGFG